MKKFFGKVLIIHDTVNSDIHIGGKKKYESAVIHGTVQGDVEIHEHGVLLLHGAIRGNLTFRKGNGSIYGSVYGNVTNIGGNVDIFGRINGCLIKIGGKTEIHRRAIVLDQMETKEKSTTK